MSFRVDLDLFLERHLAELERDQAKHNLILGILNLAAKNPENARLWSLGEGAACAVQTPPRFIALGDLNQSQCEALAKEVALLDFPGCVGANQSPENFVNALAKIGVKLKLAMPNQIYVLQKPPIFPLAKGKGRLAEAKDLKTFVDWVIRFGLEASPHDPSPSREEVEKSAFTRPVFFWEHDGKIVSMASRTRETREGSNISLVYTPPEFRGQGFAGSVTAFASQHAFAASKKMAFLYTDSRNPISNRIYKKIGFELHCEASTWVRAL